MSKPLVIVESPAKARSIGKFLGAGYTVKASRGHVRDLPKSALGVDPDKGFATSWENIKDRGSVLEELRRDLKKTDTLYLATDPDREGEAIAWHLVEALLGEGGTEAAAKNKNKGKGDLQVLRVVFHEITKGAIQEAFDTPSEIDTHRVDAYRTRRILDRLMGYQLSPLLWKKLARGLSAGRVQSVAVRLIVEREREIRAFEPQEYWRITATFGEGDDAFTATHQLGERKQIPDEAAARAILERVGDGPFPITKLEQKARLDRAKPPFITSTLQQAAASSHGFSAKRTMQVAQRLYEGLELPGEGATGLITYMRTDSFNVSGQAAGAARDWIRDRWGAKYVPDKPNAYRSKKGAQEAHEAIRPTDPTRHPDALRNVLKPEQWKLYDLIWRRFVASQMSPAEHLVTTVELTPGGELFTASGRVTVFDGYTRVYGRGGDEQSLPELREGQELPPKSVEPTQHYTSPPRRFTEASLVRELEKDGIGRPSTYASIISTIVDRGYVDHGEETAEESVRERLVDGEVPVVAAPEEVDEDGEEGETPGRPRKTRAFHATHLGEVVTDLLTPHFGDIVDKGFTANLENDLDRIAEGEVDWQSVATAFYDKFRRDLDVAADTMEPYWKNPITVPDVICGKVAEEGAEACRAPMVILFNRFGPYLGCSRYPDCKNAKNLSGVKTSQGEATDFTCNKKNDKGEVCGRPMERKVNRWGSAFLACTGFKDKHCDGTVSLSKSGEPLWPVETSVPCPDCETPLAVKRSRRGKFLACTRYPKCRGTMSLPACTHTSRTGKACGKPCTEPGPSGTMACKTHPEVKLVPKPSARKAKAGEAPDEGDDASGDDAPKAKAKAAPKKAAKKKTAKQATKKKAASKKSTPKKS